MDQIGKKDVWIHQVLAILILLATVTIFCAVLIVPIVNLYLDRSEFLQGRRIIAARMAKVAAALPELRRQEALHHSRAEMPLLGGVSDALAGAELQQTVQNMAGRAGVILSTAELLPTEMIGSYRKIKLRVAVRAPWQLLIALLVDIGGTQSGMIVDDFRIHRASGFVRGSDAALEASWTVLAFRSGTST